MSLNAMLYGVLKRFLMDSHGTHLYLSTGCLHDQHAHCNSSVNITGGSKEPGVCKWCPAVCVCPCHPTAS